MTEHQSENEECSGPQRSEEGSELLKPGDSSGRERRQVRQPESVDPASWNLLSIFSRSFKILWAHRFFYLALSCVFLPLGQGEVIGGWLCYFAAVSAVVGASISLDGSASVSPWAVVSRINSRSFGLVACALLITLVIAAFMNGFGALYVESGSAPESQQEAILAVMGVGALSLLVLLPGLVLTHVEVLDTRKDPLECLGSAFRGHLWHLPGNLILLVPSLVLYILGAFLMTVDKPGIGGLVTASGSLFGGVIWTLRSRQLRARESQ